MKKLILFTIVFLLMVLVMGCGVLFPSREQREARQTAVVAARTQRAEDAEATLRARGPTNTPRPSIFQLPHPTQIAYLPLVERPEKQDPTPTPVPIIGKLTLEEGESWVDVYDAPGDRADWIGELKQGSTWSVTQSYSLGHFWQLVVIGYIEALDFDTEESETLCVSHSWDHKDSKSLCHAHLLNSNFKLVGQIDGGIPVELLSTVSENGRITHYQIQFLVWVPENGGNFK